MQSLGWVRVEAHFIKGSVKCPADHEAMRAGSSGAHGIWSSRENSKLEIDTWQWQRTDGIYSWSGPNW